MNMSLCHSNMLPRDSLYMHAHTCASRRSSLSSNTATGESYGGGRLEHTGFAHMAKEASCMRRGPHDAKIQAIALDCSVRR